MDRVIALIVATSFAAGLNVSATIATIGLASRLGLVTLPGALDPLTNWWVIGAAAVLFVVEFVADKIPVFDLLWNALQTFIRVPAGALIAYAASADLSGGEQLLVSALGGIVALAAHAGKSAAHVAVNSSPEPLSNVLLSAAEDAFAIFLTWFATRHPFIAASIVAALLVVIALLIRWIVRGVRSVATAAYAQRSGGMP
jgi:hypothetical protein